MEVLEEVQNIDYELILEKLDLINTHFYNIEAGMRIILYILIAFLFWKVINVIYKLFGHIFFGGV